MRRVSAERVSVRLSALAAAVTSALALVSLPAAAVELPVGVALGASTCGASTCHASGTPWPNSSVSQNEYSVWRERDPHAQSWIVLQSRRAEAITARLGWGDATKARQCLACHALPLPPEKVEATYDLKDGVQCEACHGPASAWLGVHTAGLYFYGENLANGMFPTTDPQKRADLCLDCHIGDGKRFVSHSMYAAGHPPLSFELGFYSWFTKTNPENRAGYAHFTVDDDYLQRKPWPFGVKVWALGQVIQARRILALVADVQYGPKGLFPELALFECRSCHRSQKGPGVPRVALPRVKSANVLFAGFAAELVDPRLAARIRSDSEAIRVASEESWEAVIAASAAMKRTLDEVERRLAAHDFSVEDNKASLRRIAGAYLDGRLVEYEAAEQAVLSAGSLVDELDRMDALPPAEAAAALEAMARGVAAFRTATEYAQSDVRASLGEIARIMAR